MAQAVFQQRDHIANIGRDTMGRPVIGFSETPLVKCDHTPLGRKILCNPCEIGRPHPVAVQRQHGFATTASVKER